MKKFFFAIIFVFVACTGSHDKRSDEPKKNNPPSNPPPAYNPPSAPVADNSENQEEEKSKEPVEEDATHEVLVIFSDDGVLLRCWRRDEDIGHISEFKDAGFKHYYASYEGKKIASQNKLLKVIGLTRLDCCLINKKRLNHLTGKFEMTAWRLANATKKCKEKLQKEEDDLKKVKAEEEDDKEQDEEE